MNALRCMASFSFAGLIDGVELAADGTPRAFRIWHAGDNATDFGVHRFTERSATALMAEQSTRGNLYSVDVDHMSLNKESPPESRKAVGFHRLEVRRSANGPELWAIEAEWTPAVSAGLAMKPTPEWRYFSPAYDVDKETKEIVSYLNTALTNNPATHFVTSLASRTNTRGIMDYKAIAAALMGDDEEKKKEAKASLAKCTDLERKAWKAYKNAAFDEDDGGGGEGGGESKPEKKDEAASEGANPANEGEPKEETEAARAKRLADAAELLKTVGENERETKAIRAELDAQKREKIMATRPDLTENQKKLLAARPLSDLEALLALIPAPPPDPAAAARVTATRGASQSEGNGAVRASRLSPNEHSSIAARFGRVLEKPKIHWEGTSLVLPLISRADAEALIEARAKEGPLPRGVEIEEFRANIMPRFRALRGTPQAS